MTPQLTYFCELETQPLQALFADPDLIEFLVDTRAGVSLGLLDLSEGRAEVVRRLNQAGVPVNAWLLLPQEEGYWFNLDNAPQAAAQYGRFREWTAQHGLRWERIGLDIELDMRVARLAAEQPVAAVRRLAGQMFNQARIHDGTRAYQALFERIKADGFAVEVYHIPFILEERAAGSRVLLRLLGLVDLPRADVEVLMLYSSFLRPWGQGLLWSYAPQAQAIGIGSTGGGVDVAGADKVTPLNWSELQNDLLLASRHSDWLYIFSLEGCVRQGFLPRLRGFDWQQDVQIPYEAARRASRIRGQMRRAFWLLARPAWIFFGLALVASALTLLLRRRR